MVAASGGHTQIVNNILDMGTDAVDQQNLVSSICSSPTTILYLVHNVLYFQLPTLAQEGDTALLLACREGWTEVVRLLLIFGPQFGTGTGIRHTNLQGDCPIIIAARENNMDIVRLLIIDGADINCCNKVYYIL